MKWTKLSILSQQQNYDGKFRIRIIDNFQQLFFHVPEAIASALIRLHNQLAARYFQLPGGTDR